MQVPVEMWEEGILGTKEPDILVYVTSLLSDNVIEKMSPPLSYVGKTPCERGEFLLNPEGKKQNSKWELV